jgi:fumarate reductase flavoprotein subunit
MMLFATVVAASVTTANLRAADQPLLIEKHKAAGLNCAQCHHERPPSTAPANTACAVCHGDQQALADKTRDAFPNPHAPPHLAAGNTQTCAECHHVHRPSEVSCGVCHREFFFNVK